MATAKDIKDLKKWGTEDEVVSQLMANEMIQPRIYQTDYYHPRTANWSWQIGVVKIGENYYKLLTQFGAVKGGHIIGIPEYNMNILKKGKK